MAIFCDTHAHLDFDSFDPDRDAVIDRAAANGLQFIINIAIDLEGSQKSLALTKEYPGFVFSTVGIHPNYSSDVTESDLSMIQDLTVNPEVVAIGEIGLDFYRDHATPQQQLRALEAQLAIAEQVELPVVIHERSSAHQLVPILTQWHQNLPEDSRLKLNPGVMHAFSADQEFVEPLLNCNFCFGIGGPVTYKNASDKRALVLSLPMEKMLLETDCPFLSPQAHRGRRNEPAYIPLIAQKIADLRGLPVEEVGFQLTINARNLFGL